jgi:hypothetical protein
LDQGVANQGSDVVFTATALDRNTRAKAQGRLGNQHANIAGQPTVARHNGVFDGVCFGVAHVLVNV